MKILIPIPVERRLPAIPEGELFSPCVLVRFINKTIGEDYSAQSFAYCDAAGKWEEAEPEGALLPFTFSPDRNKVVEWYEEKELESLFPDDNTSYNVAQSASGDRIRGITLHQEGQTFLKNHLLRQLSK
jgi:hypothetical protein